MNPRARAARRALPLLLVAWTLWYVVVWIAFPNGDLEEAVNGNLALDLNRGLVAALFCMQRVLAG